MNPSTSPPGPFPPAPAVPRIAALDVLRGFALGGILMVNVSAMANLLGGDGHPADDLVGLLFAGKFYVLFSFLFGYSFTMQLRSAERDGAGARARTVRRCLALIVLGALHAVFLWLGDILLLYGITGLILLLMRAIRPRTALIVAGTLMILVTLLSLATSTLEAGDPTGGLFDPANQERMRAEFRSGWLEAAGVRWELYSAIGVLLVVFQLPTVLAMFLVGLAAGRTRLLEDPERYLPFLPRIQLIGYGVGGAVTLAVSASRWADRGAAPFLEPLSELASPLLSAAYAATVLRLMHRYPAVPAALAPAGRIAASNYIGQSVATSILFTVAGLELSPWAVLGVAAVVYALQLPLSAWWTRRHRYGPVEWVLRAVTYGPRRARPAGGAARREAR
ncbi:DUF418 domain-containing protein [Planomonospora venezuelensis]|uniref:DUF418 domain-containing protein n=1 Tax=Planomonospora venezuelensis TaxID=1999 RepID=A0A841DAI1_PLAVE|nr:DUF418 domain-containing protein [Planomonospora venezuelensis]MBB5965135.1 uncharacterized protein [Planomonospora venezuelensis]